MPVDPISKSPGARWPIEESTTAADRLGGGEQLAPTADRPTTMPVATAEAVGSSAANAEDADVVPESGAVKPVAPEEQTTPLRHRRAWSDPLFGHEAPGGASSRGGGGRGGRDRT